MDNKCSVSSSIPDRTLMKDQYTYYAFISHSSADEKWAQWLHCKLENYSIPTALRKDNISLPKKPKPIYWYKTDISGTNLHNSLVEGLHESKYLILICSPESAKSVHVKEEVEEFINCGKKEQIIPFIVRGQPDDPSKDDCCFPEILCELPLNEELRGPNVQKDGKNHAVVEVIATMFNLRFDTLWQRSKRRQKIVYSIIGLLCCVLAILGLWTWDYTRTKYEYYADYVIHKGIPEGIIPIKVSDLEHKIYYYRFEYSMRRLDRVVHCGRFGVPQPISNTELIDRYPIQHILYQGSKAIAIEWQDALGHTKMKGVFSDNEMTKCDIVNPQTGDGVQIHGSKTMINWDQSLLEIDINLQTFWPTPKSSISRYVYTYDDKGYLRKKSYCCDNNNTPVADMDGVCGFEYELDSMHRITTIRYLDVDGRVTSNRIGVAKRCYTYSSTGTMNSVSYFNIDNKPTMNEERCAVCKSKVDEYGNCMEELYYDEKGKPCINSFGYHHSKTSDSLFLFTKSFFDTNDNPAICVSPNYGGYHKLMVYFDKKGCMVETRFYDTELKPGSNITGESIIKYEYDKKHRPIKQTCFDSEGKCVASGLFTQAKYDDDDNCIELICTDSLGRIVNNRYDFARLKLTYNGGHIVRLETYNLVDYPAITQLLASAASIDFIRDSRNHHVEQVRLCGLDGSVLHKVLYEYDKYGNCSKMSWCDAHDTANAYYSVAREYDNAGRVLSEKQIKEDGSIVNGKYIVYKYLPNGFLYRTEARDTLGHLCTYNNNTSWSVQVRGYDHNMYVSDTFLDENEKPIVATDVGSCIIKYEYSHSGRLAKKTFFGENGEKILNAIWKAHEIRYQYDFAGNLVCEQFFGTNKDPIENAYGYHQFRCTYDLQRQQLNQKYLDCRGRLVVCGYPGVGYACREVEKDAFGNICSMKFFDENMRPTNNTSEGIHSYRGLFKARYYPLYEAYYDKNGKLAFNPLRSLAMAKSIYDKNNRIIFYINYDEYREPLFRGYAIYNSGGELTTNILHTSDCSYPIELSRTGEQILWTDLDDRKKTIIHAIERLTKLCDTIYE